MKRTILLLILLLPVFITAQTKEYGNEPEAEKLVRTAVSMLKKDAFSSRFELDYYVASTEKSEAKIGKVDLKGRLFRIELLDTEIKFNGKTQWTYVAKDNEVTITQPSLSDLQESNPMSMIEAMLTSNRIVNNEKKTVGACRVINFYPNAPKKVEYFKIVLYITEQTGLPKKIVIYQRNGDKITMNFLDLHKVKYDASNFVFKTAEYPNVSINDLR